MFWGAKKMPYPLEEIERFLGKNFGRVLFHYILLGVRQSVHSGAS